MRLVIQRCLRGSVAVDDANGVEEIVGKIGDGAVVLIGIGANDTKQDMEYCIRKLLKLRMWPEVGNEAGNTWAKNVVDRDHSLLLVSQFTLHGSLKKPKPDFHKSMPPDLAKAKYEEFVEMITKEYKKERIATGKFGEMMKVELVNDGPVTFFLDSDEAYPKKDGYYFDCVV